jgi:uncharacterized protein YndB with AHSA1/START domain
MEPRFEVQLKIQKPVEQVFEGVVNPTQLSRYFTKTASGPIVPGTTVMWSFPEFDGEFPVKVREVVKNERIVLEWESTEKGYDTRVEIFFKSLEGQATMVQIRESGWRDTPQGIESSYGNCGGWMHMLCCCKAFLEYGINLRAGGAR